MFDTYRDLPVPYEKKAPTDESIRLYEEIRGKIEVDEYIGRR